jgi:hypothetical protein
MVNIRVTVSVGKAFGLDSNSYPSYDLR